LKRNDLDPVDEASRPAREICYVLVYSERFVPCVSTVRSSRIEFKAVVEVEIDMIDISPIVHYNTVDQQPSDIFIVRVRTNRQPMRVAVAGCIRDLDLIEITSRGSLKIDGICCRAGAPANCAEVGPRTATTSTQ